MPLSSIAYRVEFMGEPPFRHVYFTGIIRDKQGRKMSKTLGNSPDPLDLIARYGADALRFGTMRSAPLGLDILFDEQSVELGRNFCNKLWNACRFRQMQGGDIEAEINPALLTSDDRWILMRLDQAIREVTTAFAELREHGHVVVNRPRAGRHWRATGDAKVHHCSQRIEIGPGAIVPAGSLKLLRGHIGRGA